MVVDDSVVVRGLIARWIDEEDAFEVDTTAANGKAAVDALDRVEPDIVLLDLEMPEMDGITALPRLLSRRPGLKVIVVSSLTQRNAAISLRCLSSVPWTISASRPVIGRSRPLHLQERTAREAQGGGRTRAAPRGLLRLPPPRSVRASGRSAPSLNAC